MTDRERESYPRLGSQHWWALRKRFLQRMPVTVDPAYLSSVLSSMTANSARTNVLPPLRRTGLIDQDGKPTDRAHRWRNSDQYQQVCEEIRREVYPEGLLDAFPGPEVDRNGVERWFMNRTGVGLSAASQMASFYILLTEADPAKEGSAPVTAARPRTPRQHRNQSSTEPNQSTPASNANPSPRPAKPTIGDGPQLCINVQIHISPDSSPEQVEKIFESMGKYIYRNS